MTLAQQLWSQHRDLADACLLHPFVQGLGNGSLSQARYRYYIAQDAFYLEAFARAYTLAGAKAPDWEGFRELHALAGGVLHELTLHTSVAAELGIDLRAVQVGNATRRYTDFLLATAWGQPTGTTAVAMAPCMRLYAYIGQQLAQPIQPTPSSHAYSAWIATYSSPEFEALAQQLEQLIERYAPATVALDQIYRYAMQCEYDFFQAAWEQGA